MKWLLLFFFFRAETYSITRSVQNATDIDQSKCEHRVGSTKAKIGNDYTSDCTRIAEDVFPKKH